MMDPTAYSSPGDELKTHRAAAIFSVVIVFSITSTVSVALRLLAKRISRSRLAREDYVVIVAQVRAEQRGGTDVTGVRLLIDLEVPTLCDGDSGVARSVLVITREKKPPIITSYLLTRRAEIFLGSAGHHLDAIPPAHIANFLRVRGSPVCTPSLGEGMGPA